MKTIEQISVEEFLEIEQSDTTYEFIDNRAVAKVSPKYFHSTLQLELMMMLAQWCQNKGRVRPEWAVKLKRNNRDWIPVPDLLYVSFERLDRDWSKNEPCPIAPELAIEIISPGQTFASLIAKAGDYLNAGIQRVWIVDPVAKNLVVFYPDRPPITLTSQGSIADELFTGLNFTIQELFDRAGIK